MTRIKCTISYDGSSFSGYQRQPGQRTVQGEIEKVLSLINKKEITIHSSGRTDSGVHAYGQIFHFDSEVQMSAHSYVRALNGMLPTDIYVKGAREIDDEFHSRLHAKKKEYHYKVSLNEYDPMRRNYTYFHRRPLDIEKMRDAMRYLIGTHDFTSFCGKIDKLDKVRTIHEATVINEDGELTFIFKGTGFLRYQIRIMMGTLLDIGEGKKQPEDIKVILERKNRQAAGRTANPEGLYLQKVTYDEIFEG